MIVSKKERLKMTITIGHISDSHGKIWPTIPPECDIIVHSGDGIPNASRGDVNIEPMFQTNWIKKNLETYRNWIGGRPFFYCMGNHCFVSVADVLNENGVAATCITNKLVEYNGLKIYGFPYVPYFSGYWNFGAKLDRMDKEIKNLKNILTENKVDILVAHSPIANILDFEVEHIGNTLMANMFAYELDEKYWPRCYLTGHVHGSGGTTAKLGDMIISNAACGLNIITI